MVFPGQDGEITSRKINLDCLQGSMLWAMTWNLTFEKLMRKNFPENSQPVAFADNVAFVISENARREIKTKVNQIC